MNDYFASSVHRTWVQLLVDHGYKEVAALAIDIDVNFSFIPAQDTVSGGVRSYMPPKAEVRFSLPSSNFAYIKNSERIKEIMQRAILAVLENRWIYIDEYDEGVHISAKIEATPENLEFGYLMKLIQPDQDWQNEIRALIVTSGINNQGNISRRAFERKGKKPLEYTEMLFASQSEIRIAAELERRQILFFPLPLAVRADTGDYYKDHREVDFLVCHKGVWGILEVSYHPDRFEKDAEKNAWFIKSGILCIQHSSAERCYSETATVIEELLSALEQHKR